METWGIDQETLHQYVRNRKILRLSVKTTGLHKSLYECFKINEELKQLVASLIKSENITTDH